MPACLPTPFLSPIFPRKTQKYKNLTGIISWSTVATFFYSTKTYKRQRKSFLANESKSTMTTNYHSKTTNYLLSLPPRQVINKGRLPPLAPYDDEEKRTCQPCFLPSPPFLSSNNSSFRIYSGNKISRDEKKVRGSSRV